MIQIPIPVVIILGAAFVVASVCLLSYILHLLERVNGLHKENIQYLYKIGELKDKK